MTFNATAIWRVRPSGSNTNGGGYDPGISGAGTDYSQQNLAVYSPSGTLTTSGSGSLILLDSNDGFTSAMVGNAIWITSGTNFTAGPYFITGYNSAGSVNLDHSPTSSGAGSGGSGNVGGAWANFWTNTTSALAYLVPGNTIYILGSGVPNYSSYTYDYAPTRFAPAGGTDTTGRITYAADPNTPSYGSGGMPCIECSGNIFDGAGYLIISDLYFVASGTSNNSEGIVLQTSSTSNLIRNCVLDQFGYDIGLCTGVGASCIGDEVFSSVAKRSTNAQFAAVVAQAINCNIHDCIGSGIETSDSAGPALVGNIVTTCGGTGITLGVVENYFSWIMNNNTIDNNVGNGVNITNSTTVAQLVMFNNIISNHTTAGTYGLSVAAGTAALNDALALFIDYNTYYGNTNDLNAINYGPNDTSNSGSAPNSISQSPYVAESTENYTLE